MVGLGMSQSYITYASIKVVLDPREIPLNGAPFSIPKGYTNYIFFRIEPRSATEFIKINFFG
ncbi:MAG: hypothetical protein CM1200mP12_04650 [Gammaproteobacteria bacterium]|nr:MAG: hypothetical protein CM1200mP12_04650 [Gammaproteobacteria bacterium]